MTNTSRMFKTILVGMAGLYVVKTIADTEPPKTLVAPVSTRGDSLQSQAQPEYVANAKAIQDLKKTSYSLGSEASKKAMSIYDDAYNKYVEAKKQFEPYSNNGILGRFWAHQEAGSEELKKNYEEAKNRLSSLKSDLSSYMGDLKDTAVDKVQDTTRRDHNYVVNKYTEIRENGVDLRDQLISYIQYYNDEAEKAKNEMDDTKASWWKWRSAKSQEVQDRAEAKYNYLKSKNEEYVNDLVSYLDGTDQDAKQLLAEITGKAKTLAVDAIDTVFNAGYGAKQQGEERMRDAKSYAADAQERMSHIGYGLKENIQENAAEAQAVIDDNADYVKNYAGGVKDRVAQAGYDTNDKVKQNAEYAKHYAAGVKDRVAQAGYDTKEKLQDDAEYAKYYAAGVKDRVAQAGYDTNDKVKQNAEYAKHYAAGIKDRVAQAGYDTKEKLQDDAEYMKGYMADSKDQAVQAGHDVLGNVAEDITAGKEKAIQKANGINDEAKSIMGEADSSVGMLISNTDKWMRYYGNAAKNFVSDQYHNLWNQFGVFQATNKAMAEDAVNYYTAEAKRAEDAYKDTQARWFGWKAAKSQEVQDQAKAEFEILKAKKEAAEKELKRWVEKTK